MAKKIEKEKKKDGKPIEVVTKSFPKNALSFAVSEAMYDDAMDSPRMEIVGYSGGVIEDHWMWGNLLIDLNGMAFPKAKYPILEDHDTRLKIAFTGRPDINSGALIISPENVTFVDTDASKEFRLTAKQGFPWEASIYAVPTKIRDIPDGETVNVNGFVLSGPGTIWEESVFKEVSVTVFGHDTNTKARVFSEGGKADVEVTYQLSNVKPHERSIKKMDLETMQKDHPEIVAAIKQAAMQEAQNAFSVEKQALETKLSDHATTLAKQGELLLKFEKGEAMRREKELIKESEDIWATKLAESGIPARLHGKVRVNVSPEKFIKDAILDVTAFTAAIETEIKDWDNLDVQILGLGGNSKNVATEAAKQVQFKKDIDDTATQILALAGMIEAKTV